ncbi:MAG TPA: hypothetical protein VK663_15615 [Burkholderiales bacterium]|nr:hypothetical protein [Burkholderiales bacterium]
MSASHATRVLAGAAHYTTRGGTRYRGGLFRKTLDGAFTRTPWQPLSAGLPENVEARVIAFHPRDLDVVYAGTQDGVYRSNDGGDHWERLGFPERGAVVWSIAFHPTRPNVMYAGTAPVALYRSEDGGTTWKKLNGAVSPEYCVMNFPTRVTGIAIDAGNPDDVYAALEVSGVIRSRDSGDTWTDISAPLIKLSEQPHLKSRLGSDSDASGMLDSHAITISAAAPGNPFLAVRMGIFRSGDHGDSWRDIEVGRYSPLTYCRDVVVSPHDARVMYACFSPASRSRDGSLYRSDDIGVSWHRVDKNVKANATMMSTAIHPHDPATVCCVSRCGQVFATSDSGATWRESRLAEEVQDVYAVACG